MFADQSYDIDDLMGLGMAVFFWGLVEIVGVMVQ